MKPVADHWHLGIAFCVIVTHQDNPINDAKLS